MSKLTVYSHFGDKDALFVEAARRLARSMLTELALSPLADGNRVITVGDLTVDVPQHTVTRGDEEIQLTPLEFDLLVEMARKPNQVHSREELLESVWGYRNASDTRLVNVHVQRLRSKIEHDPENPEIILTVRGVGYKTGKSEV